MNRSSELHHIYQEPLIFKIDRHKEKHPCNRSWMMKTRRTQQPHHIFTWLRPRKTNRYPYKTFKIIIFPLSSKRWEEWNHNNKQWKIYPRQQSFKRNLHSEVQHWFRETKGLNIGRQLSSDEWANLPQHNEQVLKEWLLEDSWMHLDLLENVFGNRASFYCLVWGKRKKRGPFWTFSLRLQKV